MASSFRTPAHRLRSDAPSVIAPGGCPSCRPLNSRARTWLLAGGPAAGAVALGTTKFPDEKPDDRGRAVFETLMWMPHLLGGAVQPGGPAGPVLPALPGAVAAVDRGAFWSPVIRRFSAAAMSCGAPFLPGSARNHAYQADVAGHAARIDLDDLPELPRKEAGLSTWVWGTGETLLVVGLMIAGCLVSGVLARRRTAGRPVTGEERSRDEALVGG